ncbi:phosphatidylinositol-specific phospholipase C domain-containing protein [Fodinibius saliphilus]|uniref:phosphatidylinositol-specific phospholipase C domain-containing protein n=1 Tax=Fodinibius saliphilus TaxID=1920650 RepID=UPI001109392F|nr:phosphatidylinositol-specific phospholipase C domain-containing protein [Fodinibius saliphilus]
MLQTVNTKSKQTIDFTVPNPSKTTNYSLPLYQGCDYNSQYDCWSINYVNGFFKFNLELPKKQGVNLIFQLCSATVHGKSNCPIDITVNGELLVSSFDPHIDHFYDMVWSVPADMLKAGDNEIVMKLVGGHTKVFMKYAIVDIYDTPTGKNNWLAGISDSKSIAEINLPGTHDSAAINTTVHTPYACHNMSITDQLNGGIRVLDVRLKVNKKDGKYKFITCHGDIGSSTGVNEYQSFPTLLDECKNFLNNNGSETVIMSLKIDDWAGHDGDQSNVLKALEKLLSSYPTATSKILPQLGDIRGKIFLYNRINDQLRFGAPVRWPDATSGAYAKSYSNRSYKVYVQDKYKGLPIFGAESTKLNLVTEAFAKKKKGEVVLNFASATWYGVIGVYIMGDLLNYFGKHTAANRPKTFGWTMLDYAFEKYVTNTYGRMDIVSLIISSNSNYSGYEDKFEVTVHDEL